MAELQSQFVKKCSVDIYPLKPTTLDKLEQHTFSAGPPKEKKVCVIQVVEVCEKCWSIYYN